MYSYWKPSSYLCVHECVLTVTDWTVVSLAISPRNSSTRRCVSQYYSRYMPCSTLHPQLSLCLMGSFPKTHTRAHIHTKSVSLCPRPSLFPSHRNDCETHVHTRAKQIPGLIHYELNVCSVEDVEKVFSHFCICTIMCFFRQWKGNFRFFQSVVQYLLNDDADHLNQFGHLILTTNKPQPFKEQRIASVW